MGKTLSNNHYGCLLDASRETVEEQGGVVCTEHNLVVAS